MILEIEPFGNGFNSIFKYKIQHILIDGRQDRERKGLQNPLQEVATSETEILREIVEALRQQLTVKDEQLAAKDKQIEHLTAALLSSQEQHRALTEALTTAQALHAGTIQERLTAQADNSGGQTEIMTTDTVPDPNEGKSVQERQGFFARILGRKSKK